MAGAAQKRSFGLTAEEVAELSQEYRKTKKLPNPHRAGSYHNIVATLVKLGVNKFHPILSVWRTFKTVSDPDWFKAWEGKEARDEETGKDAEARFLQNLTVLQRTRDYGRRLLEVGTKVLRSKGAVIDLRHDDKGGLLVRLSTNSSEPMKAGRAAKGKPKAGGKTQKPKSAKKGRAKAKKKSAQPKQPEDRPEPPAQ